MKMRESLIEDEKTLNDSGTYPMELAVMDPVSEIHIRFKAKNGASENNNSIPAKQISKIELVDGSNVLYSLSGEMSQAMTYYQSKKLPSRQWQAGPSENQEDHFVLRFGRWLWDKDYALVPTKFRNLQLKITWALGSGYLSGSAKLTVVAKIMEDLGTEPKGFMMAKSHYSWTTADSGDERIDLPADYPYALMLFRAHKGSTKLYTSITNLKLSLDQDKDIPFDLSSWDFLKMMESKYGLITLDQRPYGATGIVPLTYVGVGETAEVTPETDPSNPTVVAAIANVYGVDSGHCNIISIKPDGTTATDPLIYHLRVTGQAFHNCFAHEFGQVEDPESYMAAPKYGSIKLFVTQGDSGADANLALLQLQSYGGAIGA